MTKWEPIETAPEGIPILVFAPAESGWDMQPCDIWVVCKSSDNDFYIEHDGDGGYMSWRSAVPTHWMAFPNNPVQS